MSKKILGLDLGTNSLGWAVVESDNNSFQMIDKGVRIFQEGVKIEKGVEGSKAAERTGYRSARRIKYRRKLRKIETLKALIEYGYCPELSREDLDSWRYSNSYPTDKVFRDWLLTDDLDNKTPYYYRYLSITHKLDLNKEEDRFKVGRGFYHIAQRRGFISNRLEGTKESEGKVKQAISQISAAKGEKTLGHYFYDKYMRGEKIRDTYTHREEHYLQEFMAICEFQGLPKNFTNKLHKAIFYQRPLRSQKGLVGKCVFETNKSRCSVTRPEFEEYRMLCFLNNIKIKTPDDDRLRFLNKQERQDVLPLFFRKSKEHFDFEDIAKKLAPKKQYKFYKSRDKNPEDWLFNYSMKTTVSGCPVSARFKGLFGADFMNVKFDYDKGFIGIHDIWHVLFTYDSEEKLKEFTSKRLGFDDNQIKDFLKISLKHDYASLSLKAINKILPYLREGLIYSHAVFLANMEKVIPYKIWEDENNRKIIRGEVLNIITTQNEEKKIIDVVNGLVKACRDNSQFWSSEASEFYKEDIRKGLHGVFGERGYGELVQEKKLELEQQAFTLFQKQMQKNNGLGEFAKVQSIDDRVKAFLYDNFNADKENLEKLYHPAAIDVYKSPQKGKDGKLYLNSPMVSAIRNPMAMRAMHQLRKVINELLLNNIIDTNTHIHIEMSRGLLNANERKGLQDWQRAREKLKNGYSEKIKEHYYSSGSNLNPTDDDILKYQLWEEQNHKCLYTGEEISISEFLGVNPSYDIEHTIPRSLSFDNSQENKTLCEDKFNRSVKRNRIPHELDNHAEILARVEHWEKNVIDLEKQINQAVKQAKGAVDKDSKDRFIQKRHKLVQERNYWRNKHKRFTMKDVPVGFKNSQMVDIGIITKYSRLYLNTLFDKVYTVKGSTVADFRKMWGLQDNFQKKERVNHIHHCIDAITIACITKANYENLANFYHKWEDNYIAGNDRKPSVIKPWTTFTEDVKEIENDVLISHHTPDNLPKQSKKKLRKRGRIQYNKNGKPIYEQGDTVRGSLHLETFYGAIEKEVVNKKGEIEKQIKYVIRKPLDSLEDSSVKHIVDDRVRLIVVNAKKEEVVLKRELELLKKELAKSEEGEGSEIKDKMKLLEKQIVDLYSLPNKNGDPIPIKKVRIYATHITNPIHLKPQRDKSLKKAKPYKEQYHVANDNNYLMALYEGVNDKGKIIRDFEIKSNLEAGEFFKCSVQETLKAQSFNKYEGLLPDKKILKGLELPLKAVVKIGTMVVLWENNPDEVWDLDNAEINSRLYKVVGLSEQVIQKKYRYGTFVLRHNKEARPTTEIKVQDGVYEKGEETKEYRKLNHNQFNALVEGVGFKLTPLGKIIRIEDRTR